MSLFEYEHPKNLDLSKIVVIPVGGMHPIKPAWITEEKNDRNQLSEKTARLANEYRNIFIVNHIPKAAGTSLRMALNDVFSVRTRLYHYNSIGTCSPEIWRWKFADNPDMVFDDVVKHIVEKQIHLVMGHFGHPEQYGFDRFVRAFPKGHSVVFLREPHSFICSLYVFARKYFGENKSFEAFIEQDYTQNYQTDHLCGVAMDKISMVGILERYNESLTILSQKIGFCLDVEHQNVNMDRMEGTYDFGQFGDNKVWKRFDELNQTDIQLYNGACERLEMELRKLIVE